MRERESERERERESDEERGLETGMLQRLSSAQMILFKPLLNGQYFGGCFGEVFSAAFHTPAFHVSQAFCSSVFYLVAALVPCTHVVRSSQT